MGAASQKQLNMASHLDHFESEAQRAVERARALEAAEIAGELREADAQRTKHMSARREARSFTQSWIDPTGDGRHPDWVSNQEVIVAREKRELAFELKVSSRPASQPAREREPPRPPKRWGERGRCAAMLLKRPLPPLHN